MTPSLYLNKIQLQAELDRCLNCKTQPCMHACPVNCNPQEFINHAKQGNFAAAVKTICRNNPMGQTCGLICPDKFCMQACTRRHIDFAIRIPKLQATILENYRSVADEHSPVPDNGQNIAVIGAGPAGIAAASVLSKNGFSVTIFEKSSQIGGALNLIPDSRLPHEVIEKDWHFLFNPEKMQLNLNTPVEKPSALLKKGFAGVIVAAGEPNCASLNIPGEELCLSYMDYLRTPEKYKTAGKIAVIGGGNVAVDCAFTALSNGASQIEIYVRRRLSDMKISHDEYLRLLNAEINILPLTAPEKITPGTNGLNLFVHRNEWIDDHPDPIPDSATLLQGYSLIIKAIGSYADPKYEDERIIYAGDCKTGGSTIVEALASGLSSAELLLQKLMTAKH